MIGLNTERAHPAPHSGMNSPVNSCLMPEASVDSLYDTNAVLRVSGDIVEEDEIPVNAFSAKMSAPETDLHIVVRSDNRTYLVHVGPTWFLRRLGVHLRVGDHIAVVASEIPACGYRVLVAGELHVGSKIVLLREQDGKARWMLPATGRNS